MAESIAHNILVTEGPDAAAPIPTLLAGYDSIGGALRAAAVIGETTRGGAKSTVKVSVCEGTVEVSDALQIDQSLSIDYVGIAKADQKLQFLRKQKTTSESVSIVVYARHEIGTTTARNPKLALDPPPADVAAFVKSYGDSYVDSLAEGGEYYAVYTFYTETREKQESLKASLKASGIYSGVSVSVSLEVAIDSFVKTTNTNWQFDQEISGILNPQLPTREKIVDFAIAFPSTPLDAPVVIGMSTAGYEHVPGFPLDFDRIAANRRYFVGDGQVDGGLTADLIEIASLQNKVAWLKAIYACYGYDKDTGLGDFGAELGTDFNAIRKQFLDYEKDPLQSFLRPPLPSLDKGTPLLTFVKASSPKWGRDGGEPWDYGGIEEAITNQRRLVWLQLRGGSKIDQIGLKYKDVHGEGAVERHGREGGSLQNPLTLDSGEFVTEVNARHGAVVDRLDIRTNRGASTAAGGNGGEPSTWSVPQGHFVLGFRGRAGALVDQIEVVYAKFEPARFEKRAVAVEAGYDPA